MKITYLQYLLIKMDVNNSGLMQRRW